jgi:N-acetylglucosaminyldiphosphoundecaprenol N-acetyl-beta-D-mannosaminyltransferase
MERNSLESAVSTAVCPGSTFGGATARRSASAHGAPVSIAMDGGAAGAHDERTASSDLLGLPLTLVTRSAATAILQRLAAMPATAARWVCFLNSHSFNTAMLDPECRAALNGASAVFPDGVAIRVAARLFGFRVPDNLPGTDLVPAMLASSAGRCFLVGDTPEQVERAARELERRFPDWSVAGFASGYFGSEEDERRAIERVNCARPNLLLIGMGTPQQERFVVRHAAELRVPLCICVGGLFGYWSRKLIRAPRPLRRLQLEWLWILVQQPRKLRRYTIGTAVFFSTILRRRARVAVRDPLERCEPR